jgi:hypothetical protein
MHQCTAIEPRIFDLKMQLSEPTGDKKEPARDPVIHELEGNRDKVPGQRFALEVSDDKG